MDNRVTSWGINFSKPCLIQVSLQKTTLNGKISMNRNHSNELLPELHKWVSHS